MSCCTSRGPQFSGARLVARPLSGVGPSGSPDIVDPNTGLSVPGTGAAYDASQVRSAAPGVPWWAWALMGIGGGAVAVGLTQKKRR